MFRQMHKNINDLINNIPIFYNALVLTFLHFKSFKIVLHKYRLFFPNEAGHKYRLMPIVTIITGLS